MKKTIAIILLVMIVLCSIPFTTLAATGSQVSISDSNIVYTGRWISQTDGTLTANFNAGLEMRFTGTSVAVNLKASSGIAYSIDGGTWRNVIAPAGQYTLASGLTAGTHTLEMTVSFHDKHIYLEGFTLDTGAATVEALDKPTIEFIGDSITAGWIGSGYDSYNYVSNTYGFIAAENLDLYHDSVAFGGIAVVPGYGSPDNGGMQNRYDLISEYVAGESNVPKWDKSQYIPDYIVINLGTNDSAAASEFSKYYKQFLNSLRESYPNTKIVAMVPFNGAYRGAISSVISELNDSNMFFLDTAGWVESTMTTDSVHLTVEAQKICGEYLTTALSNLIERGTLENADGTPIAPETTGKYYYTNFTNGLSSSPVLSGNGSHKVHVYENLNTTYSVSNGELSLSLPNGSRLRLSNTINNLSRFKYFVIRAKGTVPAGAANAFKFNFGSYTTPGETFTVAASSVTSEYTDLLFTMPEGYFDNISTAYEATLFINNAGTATVNLTIDEMYFTDKYPTDDDSSDDETGSTEKVYYNNFNSGLSTTPTATGNGNNTAYVIHSEGGTYSCANGALDLTLTAGNYLRMYNSMTGIENYKYMVLRMKGSYEYIYGNLTGNALGFYFGSYTTGTTAKVYMTMDQLTADYSDVVIEIPEGYFESAGEDYRSSMFIVFERGGAGEVTFNATIDEIYFCERYVAGGGSDEPSEPSTPDIDTDNKVYYNDFNSGLLEGYSNAKPTGNGDNTAYVLTAIDTVGKAFDYTCANGVLSTKIGVDYQLRIQNTMTGIENYKYMVLRMKGSYEYPYGTLTGNALGFWFGSHSTGVGKTANLYMTVDQLTADYSDVVIEIPEGFFDNVSDDYKACMCITSNRGSGEVFFNVSIDEIYFCNEVTGGSDEPSEPSTPDVDTDNKVYYNDFNSGLSGAPTATGNGDNTAYVFGVDGATYSCADGVLHMELTNGNYLRIQNTMTGISDYKYMVVRMKGTYDWEVLTGNTVAFWFGSYGTPGAKLYVPVEQFTSDYSDVVIEIPAGYFDSIADDYKSCLFITTERGAKFSIDIDEIYFRNDESEEPSDPEEDTIVKTYYNDFNSGLSGAPTATGNGDNTAYVFGVDGATYSCADGILHMELTNGNYLRIQNTMTGISDYKYMVVRMKGTYDWEVLTGNTVAFWFGSYGTPGAKLYVPVEQFTSDYSDVVIEIPAGYFDSIADDYKSCLFITTERGAKFSIDIDEIYFTNSLGGEEEEEHTHNVKYGVCTECGETVYLAGDANVDGKIDVRDLVRIKKIAAGKEAKTDAADINCDGSVNAQDTTAMRRGLVAGDLVKSVDVSFDSSVKMLGRVGGTDSQGRLVLEWTDAGFEFNFTGTGFKFDVAGINIEERFRPYIAYTVDGGEAVKTRVESTSATTIEVSGLEYGTHTVKVLRINEPINNPIYVSSVKAQSAMYGTSAVLLAPNAASDKKILFIGDSITTGYGNIGTGNHPFDTADQDGMQTYAYLAAESLGADAMYVAREGRGIVNNAYNSEDSIVTMLNKKSLVLGTTYDYTSWTPDIIFVNAGTNDVTGGTTADAMTTGTVAFINSLKEMYPNAKIVWGYGAMGVNTAIKTGITSAINQINDTDVTYFEFSPCSGGGTYGHPDAEDHIALANELIPVLENTMNW